MAPAAASAAKMDRVLIRDTDHLAHFAGNLASARASRAFADVVIHCAPADLAGDKDKGKSRVRAFPTVRVHRAVLAAVSDFLSSLLASFPLEEDVHVSLDATPLQVVERIVEFAYGGEVKIAKPLVSTVCDAAHRLQIKFLKDSFVKITDKDYAAVKAGKKTLASLKAEAVAASSNPTAGDNKKSKGKTGTDGGSSDNEPTKSTTKGKTGKGKGVAKSKDQKLASSGPTGTSGGGAAAGNVVFTVLKNAPGKEGSFVVLNGKDGKPVTGGPGAALALSRGSITTSAAQRVITTAGGVQALSSSSSCLPSPLASIKNPLPPAALPGVKKVTLPPTAVLQPGQKVTPLPGQSPPPAAVIALSKGATTTGKAGQSSPQKLVSLNAFQLQTIRQPDGTEIQVLKQPSGHIMKQLKSTKSPPNPPLPQLPTQPLALAGTQQRPLLPTAPIAVIRTGDGKLVTTSGTPLRAVSSAMVGGRLASAAVAPQAPLPTMAAGKQGGRGKKQQGSKVPSRMPPKDALAIAMEAIVGKQAARGRAAAAAGGPGAAPVNLPSSPVPVSEILSAGGSKVAGGAVVALPSKPIPSAVVKSVSKRPNTNVAVVSPPGYGGPKRAAGNSAAAAPLPSVPLPTVPSAVISAARHSLSQSKLAIPSTVPDDFLMTDDSSENGNDKSNGKKEEQTFTSAAARSRGKPSQAPATADPPSRSSGRVRKQNRKYTEDKGAGETPANAKAATAKKKAAPPLSSGSRKRKAESKEHEDEEVPPPKKPASVAGSNTAASKPIVTGYSRRAAAKKAAEAVAPSSARQKAKAGKATPASSAKTSRRSAASGASAKAAAAATAATPTSASKGRKEPPTPRGAAAIAALAPGYSSSGRTLRKRL